MDRPACRALDVPIALTVEARRRGFLWTVSVLRVGHHERTLARLLLKEHPGQPNGSTAMTLLRRLRGRGEPPLADSTLLAFLQRVPLEQLDRAVVRLKKTVPLPDLRRAFVNLIGLAPVEHFGVLKEVYMTHLAD